MIEPDKVLSTFKAKNGVQVILRTPDMHDLDDLLKLINSLVTERAMITANTKQSLEAEADYLARIITDNIKGNSIHIVAEADGHVVGNAEISRGKGQSAHTCILGIGLARNYRSIGIGSALIKELFKHAKKLGLRIVYLEVFASNTHAQNLYKKMGFKMTGSFPKKIHYGSKHVDSIIMTKEL